MLGDNETDRVTQLIEEHLLIGKISSVFGVKGWVKIFSHTDPKENVMKYQPWLIQVGPKRPDGSHIREVKVTSWRPHAKTLVAKLAAIDDRNAAEAIVGAQIYTHRDSLEALDDGDFYWSDLEGLVVETLDGVVLGKISHLVETGANDVMVVVDGSTERLLPYLPEQVVKDVDLSNKRMRVDWDPDF